MSSAASGPALPPHPAKSKKKKKTVDELAAAEHALRVTSRVKSKKNGAGQNFTPTPLQAWRQAVDDVKYTRPIKNLLIRLRNAKADVTFPEFSYADCVFSEYEARIVANSIKSSLVLPVYRCV